MYSKHGGGSKLCPVSFGLALGITLGLTMFLWCVWMMYYGIPVMFQPFNMPIPTWTTCFVHALFGFLKGFVFGVVLAMLYDMFMCCCKGCCKKDCGCGKGCNGKCGCGGKCGCSCCGGSRSTTDRS